MPKQECFPSDTTSECLSQGNKQKYAQKIMYKDTHQGIINFNRKNEGKSTCH